MEKYNQFQLAELQYAKVHNVDISKLSNPALPHTTMHEIRKGLERGVDITQYDIGELKFFQLRELRFAMQNGLDASALLDNKYTSFQMHELRLGMEAKINVSQYADPSVDYRTMAKMRKTIIADHLFHREVYYCIDRQGDEYGIYTLENNNISKLTRKTFPDVHDAHLYLEKILKVDNFYKKTVHILGGLRNLVDEQQRIVLGQTLQAKYPDLKTNSGYHIIDENETFSFAYNPAAPQPYVLWNREGDYLYWGEYHKDFDDKTLLSLSEKGLNSFKVIEVLTDVGAIYENEMENQNDLEM